MLNAERRNIKATTRRLDDDTKGPGNAARRWIQSIGNLSRTERDVGLAFAWYADNDGFAWPSRYSLAVRSRLSVRTVQRALEGLVARGVLIEAGSKVTRDKRDGRPLTRTRLYRLALSDRLEPVLPATERRRLARELAGESANLALSIGAETRPIESAKTGPQTGPETVDRKCQIGTLEADRECQIGTQSLVTTQAMVDGAGEGAPLTPAPAPPTAGTTTVQIVAARGAGMTAIAAGNVVELTTAQQLATVARRKAALARKPAGGRWWDVLPVELTTAADRPNRLGDRKDWRRGPKA